MSITYDEPLDVDEPAADVIIPGTFLTIRQYAEAHLPKPITTKTVKRWLEAGELPGAVRNERGWWLIPAGAKQTKAQQNIPYTTSSGTSTPSTELVRTSLGKMELTPLTSNLPPELLPELIVFLPTFLTIPQAAYLLGISEGTIRNPDNRDYYQLHKVDRQLMMPLYRIKELRGIKS